MLLSDLGADVVRGEPGDDSGLRDEPGRVCWHRNKTLTTLDLDTDDGDGAVRRLLGLADVVVVDQPEREIDARQLTSDRVLADNADAVHLWLPPYGERGRWGSLPADAMVL